MICSPISPYVFESSTKLGHSITGDALMRALDRLQKRKMAEFESFSVHDLRRSVANCCGIELGAGPLEIEHMLNHQISDKLLRTYQAGALRNPEKLRALFYVGESLWRKILRLIPMRLLNIRQML